MPVARIITRVREDADELADDLRGRGFEIEIVSPDDIPSHSVDLEVCVEECATEEALTSAESVSQPQDVCVFIAPGAIVESVRPMVVVPLFSEPVAGPAIPEQTALSETTEADHDEPRLSTLVVSYEVAEVAQPRHVELAAANHEVQTEFCEDPPAIVSEGEAVVRPEVETVPLIRLAGGKKRPRRLRIRITRPDKVFWRVAIATAILAVGGLLTLSAHRQPLLSSEQQPAPVVPQTIPLVKARVQATTQPVSDAAARPPVIAVTEPKPTVARQGVVGRPPAEATKRTAAVRPRRHSSRNPESELIAADTVIRFGKQPSVPQMQPKKSAIKRYTDLR
jgi:hypothetical protein